MSKDGTADFDTIQSAINAAAVGCKIYVKNGTYIENVPLTLKSDIKIEGESLNAIIKLNVLASHTHMVSSNGKAKITIKDLTFHVDNTPANAQNCLFWDLGANATDILFQNVIFKTTGQLNFQDRGIFDGTTGMARIRFLNCNSVNFTMDTIYFLYATAAIQNLEISGGLLCSGSYITSINKSIISDITTTGTVHITGTDNKIRHSNFGDELSLDSGALRNSVHGNNFGRMFIAIGANYNAITGNVVDIATVDAGTGNIISGEVVY